MNEDTKFRTGQVVYSCNGDTVAGPHTIIGFTEHIYLETERHIDIIVDGASHWQFCPYDLYATREEAEAERQKYLELREKHMRMPRKLVPCARCGSDEDRDDSVMISLRPRTRICGSCRTSADRSCIAKPDYSWYCNRCGATCFRYYSLGEEPCLCGATFEESGSKIDQ
jgi:hypothetical protein